MVSSIEGITRREREGEGGRSQAGRGGLETDGPTETEAQRLGKRGSRRDRVTEILYTLKQIKKWRDKLYRRERQSQRDRERSDGYVT